MSTYQTPGTWYRAPFIVCTLVLLSGGYLLARVCPARCTARLSWARDPYSCAGGGENTGTLDGAVCAALELEGKFYLSNPDKLLYSEEDAYWFIPGIELLYKMKGADRHYISIKEIKSPNSKRMLATFSTIWRYKGGQFVEDDSLYEKIRSEN